MDVTYRLTNLTTYNLCTLHLVFPNAKPPYTATKVLPLNKDVPFKAYGSDVYAIIHMYNGDSLLQRFMFVPVFNSKQTLPHGDISYEIRVMRGQQQLEFVPRSHRSLQSVNEHLTRYVSRQYDVIQSLNPCNEIIRRKHSLFWELDLNDGTIMKIPYVTLAMRGNNRLQNIPFRDIDALRSFFVKELYKYFKNEGKYPTDFVRQSQKAYMNNDGVHVHALYIAISNFFSSLIHNNIEYKTDYNATGKMDYVGVLKNGSTFCADCEDQAAAAYDMIRLFRTIFPSDITNISSKALTLPYHFSAWLSEADVALFQGSVEPQKGQSQINHVWCALLTPMCPFVFIEPTANYAVYHKYKYLIHAWMYKNDELIDLFFVNPHNHTYGLPIADLVHEKHAKNIFDEWGKNMMENEYREDIAFVGHINTEPFSLIAKVIKNNSL